MKHLDKKVEKYYKIYHFSMEPNHTSHNNEADAFKHTYMSAEFTVWLGPTLARKIGVLQEDLNPSNPPAERNMDLHNDEIGIDIGRRVKHEFLFFYKTDDKIAKQIMDEMKKGNLIVHI